ncbi:vesicle transport v-SNARE 12-like [Rutidosis leptorrhynchoides]|uniref:vesicle transport v-SNARE 12-like n=1 Tax=Rutidosis leptorrhynchoides TaxID=125765 RepID=UPI003A9973FB
MSEVFEEFNRQFHELLADLKLKCMSARVLLEDQKKQEVTEIAEKIKEAESLMRKMDLEARSVGSSEKATLLVKMREYRNDINSLKTELKRLGSTKVYQATRPELTGSVGSNNVQGSAALRGNAAIVIGKLKKPNGRMNENRRIVQEMKETRSSILQVLQQQRDTMQQATTTVHGVKDNADSSKKALRGMSNRMN